MLVAALFCIGCDSNGNSSCPAPTVTVDPETIPDGENTTSVSVQVHDPNPNLGRPVGTTLTAETGVFGDVHALETTYSCAHDVTGPVEICVEAIYEAPTDSASSAPLNEGELVGGKVEYLRRPHTFFFDVDDCRQSDCTVVECPGRKNVCPAIEELKATPQVIPDGSTSSMITVRASDPDSNPQPLSTMLIATRGSFQDANALDALYTCESGVGGPVEICVVASDGDPSCDQEECILVQCPGPLPENICPIIKELSATPVVVPPNEKTTTVEVQASDPDGKPLPLETILSAPTGIFGDRYAMVTEYTCGTPGPVEISVLATDGDEDCDKTRSITVQCPSTIPINLCPSLYVINAIPSTIAPGDTGTEIQTRAQDLDNGPLPFVIELNTLYGSFSEFEEVSNGVNAYYTCDRPGLIEICADVNDGACYESRCIDVTCPEL